MFTKFLVYLRNLRLVKKHKEKNIIISKAFEDRLEALENVLNYKIQNRDFFIKALTHRSYLELASNVNKSNERLEFLGDSVLGLVVAEYLFIKFPDEGEGYLTKSRARLVNKNLLAEAADMIGLKNLIFYDSRYINASEKGMVTILADAFEAVLGALYLDAGLDKTKEFIHSSVIAPFIQTEKFKVDHNYKGQLLEFTHSKKMETPVYTVLKEEGPEHQKIFTIEVSVNGLPYGTGVGANKKQTEQEAAKNALVKFGLKL